MAISRRQFLKRTGVATAGALFGPSFFSNPFLRSAMAATIGDRYFITLFLDGGNDGLNTVIPVTNGSTGTLRTAYTTARKTGAGGLQLATTDLGPTTIGSDFKTSFNIFGATVSPDRGNSRSLGGAGWVTPTCCGYTRVVRPQVGLSVALGERITTVRCPFCRHRFAGGD